MLRSNRDSFDDRKDYQVKKSESLSNEELEKTKDLKRFYDTLGSLFYDIDRTKKEMGENLKPVILNAIKSQLKEAEILTQRGKEYSKIIYEFEMLNKKVEKMDKELSRTEKSVQSITSFKKKKKMKEKEKKKMQKMGEQEEDFETFKKLVIWMEQKALDEVNFQIDKKNKELINSMFILVNSFKNMYKGIFEKFEKLENEFNVLEQMKNYETPRRKERVEITKVRKEISLKKTSVIGIPVEEVMIRENETGEIPNIVEMMMRNVEKNSNLEGIFRMSGNKEEISYLLRHLDMGKIVDLDNQNPHNVACALKEYFFELPDFAPIEIWEDFFKIEGENDQLRLNVVRKIMRTFPPANLILFYRIFKTLLHVAAQEETNKMGVENLLLIWPINLFRFPETQDPMEYLANNEKVQGLFKFLIQKFDLMFRNKPKIPKYQKENYNSIIDEDEIEKLFKKVIKRFDLRNLSRQKKGESKEIRINTRNSFLSEEIDLSTLQEQKIDIGSEEITRVMAMGRNFVYADEKGIINVLELTPDGLEAEPISIHKEHSSEILDLKRLKGEEIFVSCSKDKTVKIWKVGKANSIKTLYFKAPVNLILVMRDKKRIILISGTQIFSYHSESFQKTMSFSEKHSADITNAYSSCGKFYTISKIDGVMYEWDVNKKRTTKMHQIVNEKLTCACSSSNNAMVVGFDSGKYCSFYDDGQKPFILETKKKKLKRIMELSEEEDMLVCLFEYAKKDLLGHVFRKFGIFSSISPEHHVEGLKKISDDAYVFWEEGNVLNLVKELKIVRKISFKSEIADVIPFYKEKLYVVASGKSLYLYFNKK